MAHYTFEPIGFIQSCFTEKFGIPRQPGLVSNARAVLRIEPPFDRAEAFRHLDTFTHIWVLFVFHASLEKNWKTTVRPPRLGGNQRVGVFASRSGFRPNPIGQSAVELIAINEHKGKLELLLGGVDFLHGTPVLDIKPYLPYADAIAEAGSGYALEPPTPRWPVKFSLKAARICDQLEQERYPGLNKLIVDLLALDPRPGYRQEPQFREYGMRLWNLNIRFKFHKDHFEVEAIEADD